MSTLLRSGGAVLSSCGAYRYELSRSWPQGRGLVTWIMLNPSTADAEQDDPTIRRCVDFSRGWGYSELIVVNLFALRATDPGELDRYLEPVGSENDVAIQDAASVFREHRCGLGQRWHATRARRTRPTPAGRLRHAPLYLPATLKPSWWRK